MTLLEIISSAAAYLQTPVSTLTVNGMDLGLIAANHARRLGEMMHNFGFMQKLVTVSVNGVTGGSLETAVEYGTDTVVAIKSIQEVGIFDEDGNLRPFDWTTVGESLERQRQVVPGFQPRYPTDGEMFMTPSVPYPRLTFTSDRVFMFPKNTTAPDLTVGIEAYVFTPDWSATTQTVTVTGATGVTAVNTTYYPAGVYNSMQYFTNLPASGAPGGALYAIWYTGTEWRITTVAAIGTTPTDYHSFESESSSPAGAYTGHGAYTGTATAALANTNTQTGPWLTHGSQYILWQTVIQLNYLLKEFVGRQEGNLSAPTALADAGFEALRTWDIYQFEQWRRHG